MNRNFLQDDIRHNNSHMKGITASGFLLLIFELN